jgi:hypothetical protein
LRGGEIPDKEIRFATWYKEHALLKKKEAMGKKKKQTRETFAPIDMETNHTAFQQKHMEVKTSLNGTGF